MSTISRRDGSGGKMYVPARQVLLDDVVLGRAAQLGRRRALLLGVGHVEREQPRRGGVDRHRRVHLRPAGCRRAACACGRGGRPARRPCRPRPAPSASRGRSRSGSAGRRRSTGRSGPWPGSCGRARSTPRPSSGPSRSASSTAGPVRGGPRSSSQCAPGVRSRCHSGPRRRASVEVLGRGGRRRRRARPGAASATARRAARPPVVAQPARRGATSATLEASVARWNIDSPAKNPPMRTPYRPPTSRPSSSIALDRVGPAELVQPGVGAHERPA